MITKNDLFRSLFLFSLVLFPSCADSKTAGNKGTEDHVCEVVSPKWASGNANPLLDFVFSADPTSVEHNGRLYVYATHDHQQYETVGPDGKNSYEHINSLVMMSTDDMVNWTYHGTIPTKKISPWIMNSWAPSIVKRVEDDGLTHFYLYYSDSGRGVGVLTSTSPVGPWSDPLGHDLVDHQTPGVGVPAPFDPGAVIDDNGVGWLSFGGGEPKTNFQPGHARIVRLGKDMISFDSEFVVIDAPYFFEASELNYINDTWVYTYNTSWMERDVWPFDVEKPTTCCMSYMTSKTPLVRKSWKYQHNYLKNPGEYGYDWSNNHTHLQKYRGKWYILYHNMTLQNSFNTKGGFRNVCIDEIEVDEEKLNIHMGNQTLKGVTQIQNLNPYITQQAETVAATQCVKFEQSDEAGNMLVKAAQDKGMLLVREVGFDKVPHLFQVYASGKGTIEVRHNTEVGEIIATVEIDSRKLKQYEIKTQKPLNGSTNLCLVLRGETLSFDRWQFK